MPDLQMMEIPCVESGTIQAPVGIYIGATKCAFGVRTPVLVSYANRQRRGENGCEGGATSFESDVGRRSGGCVARTGL